MPNPNYQFPLDPNFALDIPIWMTFYISNYSTFNARRTKNYIKSSKYITITLPYPRQFNSLNSQNYTAGGSLNVQAIETGNLLGTLGQQITATRELAQSFFSGGGVIRFDHMETVLEPGARRTHAFDINMIAKNKEEADEINSIALTFQANMYPLADTGSLLTMRHPPLWYFEALTKSGDTSIASYRNYWDGDPLPCVLKAVDINRSPILNIPFATEDFKPLGINVKLTFIELEPAMQRGNFTGDLVSRAQRFMGQ